MKRKNAISGRTRLEKAGGKDFEKRRMGQMDYTFLTILIVIVCAGLVMLLKAHLRRRQNKV